MRKLVVIPGKGLKPLAALLVLGVMGALVFSVLWQGSAVFTAQLQERPIVALDPGHGGYDPGAITKQGVYEKELNLQVAQKVRELLLQSGIEVLLTREEDKDFAEGVRGRNTKKQVDLNYRINLASEAKADIFVSLHINSATSQKSGAETFYHYRSETGKRLADCIQNELIKIPGMNRRIAKPGDFYVIKNSTMPAVIVELGYLSNSNEQKKLQQAWYQDQLAHAVAKGIAHYFGI